MIGTGYTLQRQRADMNAQLVGDARRISEAVDHALAAALDSAQDLAKFESAQLQGAPFDALASDIVMPGDMDGLALARAIQARRPDMPVTLVSGYSLG